MKPPPVHIEQRVNGCANRLIDVYLDTIRLPEGERVENFLVVAPRNHTANGETGVAILPISHGRIGLVHIYRHPLQAWCWEVPRGFIDSAETARDAAGRELTEETGLTCEQYTILDLGVVAPEPGILDARTHIFAAPSPIPSASGRKTEFGLREFRWFSRTEMESLVTAGGLQDSTSIIACMRYFALHPPT